MKRSGAAQNSEKLKAERKRRSANGGRNKANKSLKLKGKKRQRAQGTRKEVMVSEQKGRVIVGNR